MKKAFYDNFTKKYFPNLTKNCLFWSHYSFSDTVFENTGAKKEIIFIAIFENVQGKDNMKFFSHYLLPIYEGTMFFISKAIQHLYSNES